MRALLLVLLLTGSAWACTEPDSIKIAGAWHGAGWQMPDGRYAREMDYWITCESDTIEHRLARMYFDGPIGEAADSLLARAQRFAGDLLYYYRMELVDMPSRLRDIKHGLNDDIQGAWELWLADIAAMETPTIQLANQAFLARFGEIDWLVPTELAPRMAELAGYESWNAFLIALGKHKEWI